MICGVSGNTLKLYTIPHVTTPVLPGSPSSAKQFPVFPNSKLRANLSQVYEIQETYATLIKMFFIPGSFLLELVVAKIRLFPWGILETLGEGVVRNHLFLYNDFYCCSVKRRAKLLGTATLAFTEEKDYLTEPLCAS